jgi:hypothetical protein
MNISSRHAAPSPSQDKVKASPSPRNTRAQSPVAPPSSDGSDRKGTRFPPPPPVQLKGASAAQAKSVTTTTTTPSRNKKNRSNHHDPSPPSEISCCCKQVPQYQHTKYNADDISFTSSVGSESASKILMALHTKKQQQQNQQHQVQQQKKALLKRHTTDTTQVHINNVEVRVGDEV